jgi:hypothetical protein
VVGAGCYGSDRVPVLVGGVPQRLVLISTPIKLNQALVAD